MSESEGKMSAKDVGMTTKRDEQMAEKYATILVPLYESGICVEQYTEIDEELKRAYLAGRESLRSDQGEPMQKNILFLNGEIEKSAARIVELESLMKAAHDFMTMSGYHEFDPCEPEYQMIQSLAKALQKSKGS